MTPIHYENADPYDPVDVMRCQSEEFQGSFMTLGPRSFVRCINKPVAIAVEQGPNEDGYQGAMSLCEECLLAARKQLGEDFALVYRITHGE